MLIRCLQGMYNLALFGLMISIEVLCNPDLHASRNFHVKVSATISYEDLSFCMLAEERAANEARKVWFAESVWKYKLKYSCSI
ncbi:hypothetical protein Ahy_B04g069441 [Arachis hypogaea]|uniref:Secreted protein n=1 Tax=Arachis hypogaea TaxID=3818 RepID=A0A444ZCM8_ARAHY|nr:hypothetical protein Ahy_B04g069441 [Arachis hypogaea]